MEGSENNPIMFELMSELPWRAETFTKEEWVKSYVKARYGSDEPELQQAWQFLINGIYNCPLGNNQQGPHESIFCGRPTLNNFQASSWSKMRNYYDPSTTLEAARLMNSVSEHHRGSNNFEYDLVDITRQAIADQARIQYQMAVAAYKSASPSLFNQLADRFMQLLEMQDQLLATRKEFRLGRWLEMARSCGTTYEEKDLYEWNARVQITTWGNRYCADTGGLRDYAHKEWQGLLSDFYAPRWKAFFDHLRQDLEKMGKPNPDMLGTGANSNKTADELFKMALPQEVLLDYYPMEENWVLHHPHNYTATPEGNPVDVARTVFNQLTNEK
jgi:alpha-N-acetylglucosaminidase